MDSNSQVHHTNVLVKFGDLFLKMKGGEMLFQLQIVVEVAW